MQRPVRSRNLYSVRRVFDGRKVVFDGQSAARAMSAPFMLNQTRVRHERKHLLHDVSRHAPHWRTVFKRSACIALGPQSMDHEAHLTSRTALAGGTLRGLVRAEFRCPRESQHVIIEPTGHLPPALKLPLPSATFSGEQQAYDCTHGASSEPIGMPHWLILARTFQRILYNHVQWG
jgi:hypothetical protein